MNAQIARSLGLDAGGVEPLNRPPEGSRPKTERPDVEPTDSRGGVEGVHNGDNEDEDLGEFEFRLFSSAAAAPKVVLENDKEAHGEGGLVARRPTSYFMVTDVPAELKRQYEFAAVSGEEVLDRSRWRSWGLDLPWKVTKITTSRKARPGDAGTETGRIEEAPDPAKRKRPGKKTRIALRTKERAKRAQEEMATKKQVDKEEHLKDKKKRLNRLKKLRKRAKDKEKKMAAKGEGGEAAESDGDSDDSE